MILFTYSLPSFLHFTKYPGALHTPLHRDFPLSFSPLQFSTGWMYHNMLISSPAARHGSVPRFCFQQRWHPEWLCPYVTSHLCSCICRTDPHEWDDWEEGWVHLWCGETSLVSHPGKHYSRHAASDGGGWVLPHNLAGTVSRRDLGFLPELRGENWYLSASFSFACLPLWTECASVRRGKDHLHFCFVNSVFISLVHCSAGLWIFLISKSFHVRRISSLWYVLQILFSRLVICLLTLLMVFWACINFLNFT